MNHLYKTIFNKRTGQIAVVSEKNSNNCQSQQKKAIQPQAAKETSLIATQPQFLKKQLTLAMSVLLSGLIGQMSYAATITQSYTGTESLTNSSVLANGFKDLINNPDGDKKGIVVLDTNNNPVLSDTTLTIDYSNGTTPDFIVAGYATFNKNNPNDYSEPTAQTIEIGNNKVILKQGNINGSVYAGLVQHTQKTANIDCVINTTLCENKTSISKIDQFQNIQISNNTNSILIEENDLNHSIGDLTTGQNLIHLQYADINANTVSTDAYTNTNTFTANQNQININGETTVGDLTTGQNLIHLQYADINANTVSTDAYTNTNTFTANQNQININGETTVGNLTAGQNLIHLQYADINATDLYISANADINANTFTANQNQININGETTVGNLTAGQAGVYFQYGNLTTGAMTTFLNGVTTQEPGTITFTVDLSNTDINVEQNLIHLKGQSSISGNVQTGVIDFNISHNLLNNGIDEISQKILIYKDNISPVYCDDHRDDRLTNKPCRKLAVRTYYIKVNGTQAFSNNNTISIVGEHTFSNPQSVIYGGYLNYNKEQDYFLAKADGTASDVKAFVRPETYDVFTGNTLNYNNSVPITIKEIGNFQNYNFTLNPALTNQNLITANTVYLGSSLENMSANQLQKNIYNTVSQEALASASVSDDIKALIPTIVDDPTDPKYVINPSYVITEDVKTALLASDISQQAKNLLADNAQMTSNIYVVGIQSGPVIAAGTKFVLMQADKGNLKGDGQGYLDKVSQVQQGISLLYDVQTVVDHDNDQVYALFKTGIDPSENIPTPSIDPEVNPHLKALLEGNLSGLMLLTRGADHLSDNLFGDEQHKRGLVPFAIFSGQHSRYNTGSHIKSNSGLFTAGFSVYDDNTVWGAFIENGWDSYKTYNDFDNAPDVHGKGHNRFNGVGVFGRYTFDNQVYLDGTLRGGRLHTAFETDDIRHIVTGERASYNISGNYYGASLKGGYDWAWNTQNTVDLSAKYSWASTSSHDVNITGDEFHFDGLNSHRILLNAENSYQFTPELSLISGLGYEYEFDGKAEGTTYGRFEIDDASVKGSTGVVTAGLHYEPSKYKRLSIDLKGSGYFGKREGGSALLKVDYKF